MAEGGFDESLPCPSLTRNIYGKTYISSDMPLRYDFASMGFGNDSVIDTEALPSSRRPAPFQAMGYPGLQTLNDPDLCLTPEKNANRVSRTFNSTSSGQFQGSRSSLKVRFDDIVDVRHLADELHHYGDTDSSEDEIIEVMKCDYHVIDDDETHTDVSPTHESSVQFKTVAPRSVDVRTNIKDKKGSLEIIQAALPESCYVDHALAQPQAHSVLKEVKKIKITELADQEVVSKIKEKLDNSTQKQKQIAEKVCKEVEVKDDRFFGQLTNVEVGEIDASAVAKVKVPKTKPVKQKSRPQDRIPNPPDIMDFFTPDRQKEYLSFSLRGIDIAYKPQRLTADLMRGYELYKHRRAWDLQ